MRKYEKPRIKIIETELTEIYRELLSGSHNNSMANEIICKGNGGIFVNGRDKQSSSYIKKLIEIRKR